MKAYVLTIDVEGSDPRTLGVYSSLESVQENMRNYVNTYYRNVADKFEYFVMGARYRGKGQPGPADCWLDIRGYDLDQTLGRPNPGTAE